MTENNDFDIDFDFKPITDGLGFHHSVKEKKNVELDLKSKSEMLRSDLLKKTLKKETNGISRPIEKINTSRVGELAAFYSEEKESKKIEIKFNEPIIIEPTDLLLVGRAIAFILDLIILVVAISTLSILALILGEVPLAFARQSFSGIDFQVNVFFVFYFIYSLYFSFFDTSRFSTLGKNIMGLQVASSGSKRLTMAQSYLRANLVLLSSMTLGLFGVLDLQSKLTSTRVKKLHV
jgi:uncharacterized RDD family membrane protein YckC